MRNILREAREEIEKGETGSENPDGKHQEGRARSL